MTGCSARHRLGHDDAERLLPQDRHQQGRGGAQKRVLLGVVDRADVAYPIVVDVRGDVRLEPGAMLLRHVAGEDEPAAGTARGLDGEMRALDLLDATEKDQRRIGRHGGAERIGAERHAVRHEVPSAGQARPLHHAAADGRELQRAARQPVREGVVRGLISRW